MDTQSLLASFEAFRARLPAGARIVLSARDFIIDEISVAPDASLVQRLAILFDVDRDTRSLEVLSALYLRDHDICTNVLGLAETRGELTVWYGDATSVEMARNPVQQAANAALWPYDSWRTRVVLAPMLPNGKLDRDNLSVGDPLRVAPARYPLGRILPRSPRVRS